MHVSDESLSEDIDAIYFGGGYPEIFTKELSANKILIKQLNQVAKSGMSIYGECGGFIYLGRTLTIFNGIKHEMTGLIPIDFVMDSNYLSF